MPRIPRTAPVDSRPIPTACPPKPPIKIEIQDRTDQGQLRKINQNLERIIELLSSVISGK